MKPAARIGPFCGFPTTVLATLNCWTSWSEPPRSGLLFESLVVHGREELQVTIVPLLQKFESVQAEPPGRVPLMNRPLVKHAMFPAGQVPAGGVPVPTYALGFSPQRR